MRARASTDGDGLRWKHPVWNATSCSLFLILRYCSSLIYPFSPLSYEPGAGLVPVLVSTRPIPFYGEGVSVCHRDSHLESRKNFKWWSVKQASCLRIF